MPTSVKPKRILAGKLETTSGTAIAVADADFDVRVNEIEIDPEIEAMGMAFASGRHSFSASIMGKKKATVNFKYPMRLGAAAATAPKFGKFLKACGALETVGGSSVVYTPSATKDEGDSVTMTLKVMEIPTSGNALIYTIKGCLGNCVISMDDLGQPLVAAFTFTGAFASIADGTALVLTSPDTSNAPAVIGATITYASTAQQIGKMQLDFGNDVQLDYDPADATGFLAAYIAARKPKLMLDPKAKLIATDAHYTRWAAGTESVFSLATSTVGGLKWTLGAPKAQVTGFKVGERNSEVIWEIENELHESSGNDEWSLTQSA